MQKTRYLLIVMAMLLCSATSAAAEISIGVSIWTPNVSIGINLPAYPQLVPVPGYPVYYAPQLRANYFFYDGMYWVYSDDNWYASYWYNGPWLISDPFYVPFFILRIPVRYYRYPPVYFRGWSPNAPPRWGHHWGQDWARQRSGWDRWERSSAPARAPLPTYQRQYSGERYPKQVEQQRELHNQQYRYQPKDPVIREHFKPRLEQRAPEPAQRERQEEPRRLTPKQEESQRQTAPQQDKPRTAPQQQPRDDKDMQRSTPGQRAPQQPDVAPREQKQQEIQRPVPPRQDSPKATPQKQQPRDDEDMQKSAPDQRAPQQPKVIQREQPAPRLQEQKQEAIEKQKKMDKENEERRKLLEEERGRGRNN